MFRAAVPEASVHEYRNPFRRKRDVWSARKTGSFPEPTTKSPQCAAKCDLGFGVHPTNSRHAAAALFCGHHICHDSPKFGTTSILTFRLFRKSSL
jgi:hypothetical protein